MLDPPRQGVRDAVAQLHAGGVKVVMIAGDAVHTALAIARTLGLRTSGVGAGTGVSIGVSIGAGGRYGRRIRTWGDWVRRICEFDGSPD